MSVGLSDPDVRRGAIIAIDGLAIALLSVILAISMGAGAVDAGGGLLGVMVATVVRWLATPGVELLELTAYVGLSLVLLGPGWYLALRPFFGDSDGTWRDAATQPIGGFDFESDRQASTVHQSRLEPDAVTESLKPRVGQEDWVGQLLEGNAGPASAPQGDFYRGGTASANATTDDGSGPGPNLSSLEEIEDELERDVVELETVYDAEAEVLGGDTWTAPSTAAFVRAATAGRAVEDATAEAVEAHRRERADPVDRLADEIETSRGRLERVGNRLRLALGDRSAVRAGRAVSGIVDRSEATLEPLERHDPAPAVDLSAAIESMRTDQRQTKAAFAAALRDD